MALTALPSAHILSIGSGARVAAVGGVSRREEECHIDGHAYCQPVRKPSSKISLRAVKLRAHGAFYATALTDSYRSIGQLNEAIRNAESVQAALKILEEIKTTGIYTPNEATYASLMLACRKHRQGERALTVYEVMKQTKEPISLRTYNTLMSCCQQSLRLDDAMRIKTDMEEAGVLLDVVTYTSLLDTVVRSPRLAPAQRLQRSTQIYKEMESLGIIPDIRTYNALIQAAADAKAIDRALELYQALAKSGLTPTAFTFDRLLKCFGAAGRLKLALQVYNEARAAGITLYAYTYNFLIEACAISAQPSADKAWDFYEEMKTNDIKLTAQTYINLISACSKSGDNAGVMKAFKLMKEDGLIKSITTTAFNQIMEAASVLNTLDDSLQIYRDMKAAGFKPNASTYGSMISACIRHKDFKQAEALEEEEFKGVDVSSNLVVLNSLIRAYGDADKWEDSVRIFRDMLEKKGMTPSDESFSSVFEACFGKERIAALIGAENPELKVDDRVQAGLQLYEEFSGKFANFTSSNLARCDLKTISQAGAIFATLSWLKAVRSDPPATDLIAVIGLGSSKDIDPSDAMPGSNSKPRYSKRYTLVMKVIRAVGLPANRLNTLSMLALTVSQPAVLKWIKGPEPFSKKQEQEELDVDDMNEAIPEETPEASESADEKTQSSEESTVFDGAAVDEKTESSEETTVFDGAVVDVD